MAEVGHNMDMALLIAQGRGFASASLPLPTGGAPSAFFSNGEPSQSRLELLTEIARQQEMQVLSGAHSVEDFIQGLEKTALSEGWTLSPYAYRTIAELFDRTGRLPDAIPYFQKLIASHPDDFYILNHLGVALVQLSRYGEAKPYLTKALELNPEEAQICSNLGLVLRELKEPDESGRLLHRAIVLDPSYAYGWINLAILLHEQGKLKESADTFLKGLSLPRENLDRQPHLYGDAHLLLAQVLLELGQNEPALESAEKAVESGCQPILGRMFQANCLLALGHVEEARESLALLAKDQARIASDAALRRSYEELLAELADKEAKDERRLEDSLEDFNRRFPKALRRLAE